MKKLCTVSFSGLFYSTLVVTPSAEGHIIKFFDIYSGNQRSDVGRLCYYHRVYSMVIIVKSSLLSLLIFSPSIPEILTTTCARDILHQLVQP